MSSEKLYSHMSLQSIYISTDLSGVGALRLAIIFLAGGFMFGVA